MKNTKTNIKDLNRELDAAELNLVSGGADEESYTPYSPEDGTSVYVTTPVVPAAPATTRTTQRRIRKFREVTVNGQKKLVGYWAIA